MTLLRLLLLTLTIPSTFPSITCFRRQSLSNIWTIHLGFLRFIALTYSTPLSFCVILTNFHTFGQNDLLQPCPAYHFENFPGNFDPFSEMSNCQHHKQLYFKRGFFDAFFLAFKSSFLAKSFHFLLNAAFATAI